MFEFLKQDYDQPDAIKMLINIGACLDVPTGFYVKGVHGQNILLGGLGAITAVVGRGNRFKSTVLHYMMLSAMNRLFSTSETSASTYDTEINIHETALERFIVAFENLRNRSILAAGIWNITDSTCYLGNKWFEATKKYLKSKKEHLAQLTVPTPFFDRDGKTQLKVLVPTFGQIDSFSEFETEDVAKISEENELGESGANMIHMRQGLSKTHFLMEAPVLFNGNNHFLLITAHMDDAVEVATGPYAPKPVKKLQHLKQGDKIKGVTGKFFFLMNNCWAAISATPLINQGTKGPEYPRDTNDNMAGDKDLNEVVLTQLRSKAGPTGYDLTLVVSQSEGVLPSLTEFHYIKSFKDKNFDRYGISGNIQNYNLDLLPDVKLSRTTIRGKIDSDVQLRRVLTITAEMCQIYQFHRKHWDILCTPKELYEDLINQGYDWNVLLNTRSWWTVDDDKHPLPFLSTLDLMLMHSKNKDHPDAYFPYWMNPDKSIKKEFCN